MPQANQRISEYVLEHKLGGGTFGEVWRAHHHVWIDHCEVWDAYDGNMDITHGSNWITVSWTKFRYSTAPAATSAVPGISASVKRS